MIWQKFCDSSVITGLKSQNVNLTDGLKWKTYSHTTSVFTSHLWKYQECKIKNMREHHWGVVHVHGKLKNGLSCVFAQAPEMDPLWKLIPGQLQLSYISLCSGLMASATCWFQIKIYIQAKAVKTNEFDLFWAFSPAGYLSAHDDTLPQITSLLKSAHRPN